MSDVQPGQRMSQARFASFPHSVDHSPIRILKWLFGALVLLVIVGAAYQFVGMVLDRMHYPPPGRMVDVGGHRLHLYCIGKGSPTVVLEAAAPG